MKSEQILERVALVRSSEAFAQAVRRAFRRNVRHQFKRRGRRLPMLTTPA